MKKQLLTAFLAVLLAILLIFTITTVSDTHIYGEIRQTEATCGEEGRMYRTCILCGKVEYGEVVPAVPHDFGETINRIRYETAYAECSRCKATEERPYTPPDGIARLYIEGTPGGTVIPVSFRYVDGEEERSGFAEVRVNGSIDRVAEKPDYDFSLYSDGGFSVPAEFFFGDEVGTVSALTLRANYYDLSGGAWNLGLASLWENVSASRENLDPNIAALPHLGAESGKPILFYTNGNFKGVYTLCTPDDESLYGLNDGRGGAVLYTHTLFGDAPYTVSADGNDIPVTAIAPNEADAYIESFQSMLDFAASVDEQIFADGIGTYLDIDAMIDYMAYLYALDLRTHDKLFCRFITYDGKKWIPSPYALDDGLGRGAAYDKNYPEAALTPSVTEDGISSGLSLSLYDRIWAHFSDRIAARYLALRSDVLSDGAVAAAMENKIEGIPEEALNAEFEEYPDKNRFGNPITQVRADSLSESFAADAFFERFAQGQN